MTPLRLLALRWKGISASSCLFMLSVTQDESYSITAADYTTPCERSATNTSDPDSFPKYFGKFLPRAQIVLDDNVCKQHRFDMCVFHAAADGVY